MKLETERLELIPLDLEQMQLWTDDLPALEKVLGVAYQAESAEGIFCDIIKSQAQLTESDPANAVWYNFWFLVRKSDSVVVGSACFKNKPNAEGEVEIGYGLGPQYERNGYMTEAVKAMCQWALKQDGLAAVLAETDLENGASHRILERCGFVEYSRSESLWWRLGC